MDSILKVNKCLDHILFLQLIIIVFGNCTSLLWKSYRLAALPISKIPTECVRRIACWCLRPKLLQWSAECRQPSPCPISQRSEIQQGSSNLLLSRVSCLFLSIMVHSYRYGMLVAVCMGTEKWSMQTDKERVIFITNIYNLFQEMRHQLSSYSDTLPPNAAYVNVTSVNMLLLKSDTRSPSTPGAYPCLICRPQVSNYLFIQSQVLLVRRLWHQSTMLRHLEVVAMATISQQWPCQYLSPHSSCLSVSSLLWWPPGDTCINKRSCTVPLV